MSELLLSQVNLAHLDFRFDPEFYNKANLRKEEAVRKIKNIPLGSLCKLIAGPFGSAIKTDDYDPDSKFRYVRATDIKSFFLNDNSPVFIREETFNKFPQFHLIENDVLLTVVGMNFGIPAVIQKEDCPAIFSCKSTLIRDSLVNSYYLLAYLSSDIGHGLVRRGYRGAAQPGINLSDIESILVPIVEDDFQQEVESLIKCSRSIISNAKTAYQEAEFLLLETLDMVTFLPGYEAINIKSFKDSFATTGRLDAEYYQPKYEQIAEHIKAQSHDRLIKLVDIKKSIEPGSDAYSEDEEGLPFLRVADYSKYGITKPQKCLSAAFIAENIAELKSLKPKKNTILFSKDGSVGEAYCLREDANFITSGAVLHLNVLDTEHVLPEYLTLVLNSKLVRMQSERDAGGSIILHWRMDEIENVVVPLVDMPTQEKIAAMVQESFSLKVESERLLNVAKRAVEIAIEQDENQATAYIRESQDASPVRH